LSAEISVDLPRGYLKSWANREGKIGTAADFWKDSGLLALNVVVEAAPA
jgi:hypothetical protein